MTAVLKINPARPPKPFLPPTMPARIDEPVSDTHPDTLWRFPTAEERKKERPRTIRCDAWTQEIDDRIWVMYYTEHKTHRQIGEEMGRTKTAICVRLQKLRKMRKEADQDEKENEKAE